MFEEGASGYDIIGDIHGEADELETLLKKLGYSRSTECYQHPVRKAIFVGDLIDRGPKIRETLALVKAMHDHDQALVTLGNHEYNAVCFCTGDKSGGHLRENSDKNCLQFLETSKAFFDHGAEWDTYLDWFKSLPLSLDCGEFRIAHACWSQRHIELIAGRTLANSEFLHASAKGGLHPTPEFLAVETILKGPEMSLPRGHEHCDKEGHKRSEMRVKWWDDLEGATYRSLSFPVNDALPDWPIEDKFEPHWDTYPSDAPPVFVGHYWLPPQKPEAFGNVVCLDYSVAKDGFATAFRWDSGCDLTEDRFVTSN